MFRQIGPLEILIVFFLILLLFGPGRITKVAGELGKAIKSFKNELTGDETDDDKEDKNNTD